jgi:hypothetical protein
MVSKLEQEPITDRVLAVLVKWHGWDSVRMSLAKLTRATKAASEQQTEWAVKELIRQGKVIRLERPGDYRVITE